MRLLVALLAYSPTQRLLYSQTSRESQIDRHCDNPGLFRSLLPLAMVLATPCLVSAQALSIPWSGYAHDPQHTATSPTAAQALNSIHWQTPVDMNAPAGGPLFVHYGSPVITAGNTVIVPESNDNGGFQLNAFNGLTGQSVYSLTSDYSLPAHDWTPPYGPALALGTRLFYAGAGGTIYYRDLPNSSQGPNGQAGATGQFAFYGMAGPNGYTLNQAAYQSAVQISTPLTTDRLGNVYFGFTVSGANPLNLTSGIAKVSFSGVGMWTSAISLTGDSFASQIAMNCAPALNNTQTILYVATSNGAEFGTGYLASLSTAKLAPISSVALNDPQGGPATVSTDSSASPMVGPDGDVYFGVLENNCCGSHNDRGWLLHFDSTLSQLKIPGSFGWDDTASVVPASVVPSYAGRSSYLILTKYNNYAGIGTGNGVNKVAILDPSAGMPDEYSSEAPPPTVMREVITVTGVTPNPTLPSVREWCINTAAIDPYTKSAIINSEDGTVYRWDFTSNSLLERLSLTAGRGEAYTPTVIGPDGTVYAINDAILFAVGN